MKRQKFSRHMGVHYILAAGAFGAVLFLTESFLWAALAFLINIFLDVDHLFDYWLANGFDLNYKKFIKETIGDEPGLYFRKSQKVIVLLHSWELLSLIFAVAWVFGLHQLALTSVFGLLPHLIWDQMTYAKEPLMYFFVFRALHKFDLKKLCG